jgi:hypothetical protein
MTRRQSEQTALDIVAGRNHEAPKVSAGRMSPIVVVSIGLWLAVIVGIGAVAVYFFRR